MIKVSICDSYLILVKVLNEKYPLHCWLTLKLREICHYFLKQYRKDVLHIRSFVPVNFREIN